MTDAERQPVAFFGHGSPLNTLARNAYTHAWQEYAARLPTPRAIVVVSAHWYVPGTRILCAPQPATMHDFNARFPPALFAFHYPARTDAGLVERLVDLLAPARAVRDASTWGIDHGAYSILAHLFPAADVPVVQISIDRAKPPLYHYELAKRLGPLRDEGVFIMTSGNIVHNLELADPHSAAPYDWAQRFDERVCTFIASGDHAALIEYQRLGSDARLSVPTPDHYLPLLYALALQRDDERVTSIADGFSFRAGSMRSLSIGA
jgi:4,5-DOPA dioxygenase extradiol